MALYVKAQRVTAACSEYTPVGAGYKLATKSTPGGTAVALGSMVRPLLALILTSAPVTSRHCLKVRSKRQVGLEDLAQRWNLLLEELCSCSTVSSCPLAHGHCIGLVFPRKFSHETPGARSEAWPCVIPFTRIVD